MMKRKKNRFLTLCIAGGMAAMLSVAGAGDLCRVDAADQPTVQSEENAEAELSVRDRVSVIVADASGEVEERIRLWSADGSQYYAFLPSYADLSACVLKDDAGKTGIGSSGQILCEADQTLQQIQTGKTYSLMDDGEMVGSIIFMQASHVNTVYIQTESGNMDYIHETKGNMESGRISCFTDEGELDYQGALEQIRGRGNNTWLNEKKPYQFKLGDKINLYGCGAAKTWILLAGAADGSGMRNKLVYDMAQAMDVDFAQNTTYVDLYLNGEYAGLYLLSEKIQIGKNRIEIDELEKANEKANPDIELSEAEVYRAEDGNRWGITGIRNPEDMTGGYLLERDNYFEQEPSAFRLASGEKFTVSSPDYASEKELNYIADTMQHVENAILADDGIDEETGKNYKELIDFDGLVKKYLFDEVTKCDDGWRGSNYFYKMPDGVDTKVYCGPIWDYDLSLGNAPEWFVGDDNPQGITQTRLSVWYQALWRKAEFREAVIETYNTKFKPYLEDAISGTIAEYTAQISASMEMNQCRWKEKNEYVTIYDTFEEQVNYLKYFIEQRLGFLDEVWNEGQIYHEVIFGNVPRTDNRTDKWEIQYIKDGECAQTPATPTKDGYRFLNWYYEGTTEVFSPYQPVWKDTVVVAGWEELTVTKDEQQQSREGNMDMIFIIGLLILVPGMITMKLSGKKYEQEKNALGNRVIDICIYDFIIMLICYGLLTVLGSSGLSVESVAYPSYTLRYAVMAAGIAVAGGVVSRLYFKKK